MRRDGKDNKAMASVIKKEFERAFPLFKQKEFVRWQFFSSNGVNVKMIAIQLLMLVIKLMLMIFLAVPVITKLLH